VFVVLVSQPFTSGRKIVQCPNKHRNNASGFGQPARVSLLTTSGEILAVVLAVVGLYSVMAFAVVQRAKEIGLRIGLGASSGQVLRMVIGEGMRLIVPGIAVGAAVAMASSKILASFVYGVRPTDPATFLAVAAGLIAVSLVAMVVPARRASRIDPIIALRQE
jgi:ABC-type antimicrobial peptide transport system permease subunit